MSTTTPSLFDTILARAEEPSTYAGVATILAMTGVHIADPVFQAIVHTLTAIAGLVAVVKADKASKTVAAPAVSTPAINPLVNPAPAQPVANS